MRKSQGFTLIELLIVIAIIGILAAVLIPNLLNARVQAQARAAQAHSANVFTAVTAALAEDIQAQPENFKGRNCKEAGTAGSYSWNAAPPNVQTCTIEGDNATGTVTVTVVSPQGTFVNGAPDAAGGGGNGGGGNGGGGNGGGGNGGGGE